MGTTEEPVAERALPRASRITARMTTLTTAWRPASPVFGERRPVMRTTAKPARKANSADERPFASSIR